MNRVLTKTNAAATRAKIIGRIKRARGKKAKRTSCCLAALVRFISVLVQLSEYARKRTRAEPSFIIEVDMPQKCTTGRQFPNIQKRGCTMDGLTKAEAARAKAKAKAPAAAKAAAVAGRKRQRAKEAAPPAPEISAAQNLRRNNPRVALELEENLKTLRLHEKLVKALTKTNAAATRAKIIGRIKRARGKKA